MTEAARQGNPDSPSKSKRVCEKSRRTTVAVLKWMDRGHSMMGQGCKHDRMQPLLVLTQPRDELPHQPRNFKSLGRNVGRHTWRVSLSTRAFTPISFQSSH